MIDGGEGGETESAPAARVGGAPSSAGARADGSRDEGLDLSQRADVLQRLTEMMATPEALSVLSPPDERRSAEEAAGDGESAPGPAAETRADASAGLMESMAADLQEPGAVRGQARPDGSRDEAAAVQGDQYACLAIETIPETLWSGLEDDAALASIEGVKEVPLATQRDGPEGKAALARLAALSAAVERRPTSPDVAAVLAELLPDCMLASALKEVVDAVGRQETDDLAVDPAWRAFLAALIDAPLALRTEIAFRLAARFIARGDGAALALVEPFAETTQTPGIATPRRALIEAELSLARGEEKQGMAALADLAGAESSSAQIAAVLLAERSDPFRHPAPPGGWLGLLDLLGSIALEHRGTPISPRAALAEAELSRTLLGPAETMKRLSLSHARGVIDTPTLQRAAAMATQSDERLALGRPLSEIAILRAEDPSSFAAVDAHVTEASMPALEPSEAVLEEAAPAPAVSPASAPAEAVPNWRALISALEAQGAQGATGASGDETVRADRGGEGRAGAGSEEPRVDAAAGTTANRAASPSGTGGPAARDKLLMEVEQFLSLTAEELAETEAMLDDG
ncbi:MAG: hypothetical protein AAF675_06015 [Pseudomonadota bacterium]